MRRPWLRRFRIAVIEGFCEKRVERGREEWRVESGDDYLIHDGPYQRLAEFR